jgi:D-3-phosphoglycerate dehydrogenase / 2-oxoglutarate reductase
MRILVAEKSSFSEHGLQAYAQIAATDAFDLSQDGLQQAIQDYEILVVRLGLRVDEAVLERGARLLAIGTPTTGLDHIDLQIAERRGIAVLSLNGERAFLDQVYATAEHTFALLLSLVRNIPSAFSGVKEYQWRRDLFRGHELSGKTLGIIGCGRLGSMVARYATAFGMTLLVYDPYQEELPEQAEICGSLTDLLARSDVVTLHVPLNAETQDMLSGDQFDRMKPGAFLVNTARGALIDEGALLRALESGRLAGAALDVLHDEHRLAGARPHPLIEYARTHENLLLTPHIGGATQESIEKADLFIAEKIKQFLLFRG